MGDTGGDAVGGTLIDGKLVGETMMGEAVDTPEGEPVTGALEGEVGVLVEEGEKVRGAAVEGKRVGDI